MINPLADKLKGYMPESVRVQLAQAVFDDITPLRLAHFLAQCDHESGGFRRTVENLNYSAAGLLATFGTRFQGVSEQYARQPQKIANRAYANRMGNGNEESGDGWKFRGRGFIQLSMRDNYNRAGISLGVDFINSPDLVSKEYALSTALWFFTVNKIWEVCDRGATEQVIKDVTRRVNGGTIGLDDRIKKFNFYWSILK